MKIGILTFHRACNYGAILQCYALTKILNKDGNYAEVINYYSPVIENTYKIFRFNNLKEIIKSIIFYNNRRRSIKIFRSFLRKYINTSSHIYHYSNELNNKYDLVFIGSDQIWSCRINKGFDPIYWGNFTGIKATYAASMGTDHSFTNKEYNIISKYLCNFNHISVREDSLRDEIKTLTSKTITTVIDPTLLLEKEDYEALADIPSENNFIFHYQMEYSPNTKYFMSKLALQLKCKVITVGGPREIYEGVTNEYHSMTSISVERFIGYILKAKCIVASSFHGTALPIAMRKDFYFLPNYASDRSENLLRYIGALDRIVNPQNDIIFSSVDYKKIEEKLSDFKRQSFNYIKRVIDDAYSTNNQ